MATFIFHVGLSVRAYGDVSVTADNLESALELLDADFVSEHVDMKQKAIVSEAPFDIAVIDVKQDDVLLGNVNGISVPSPFDPLPSKLELAAPDMLAVLKSFVDDDGKTTTAMLQEMACLAIKKAEG